MALNKITQLAHRSNNTSSNVKLFLWAGLCSNVTRQPFGHVESLRFKYMTIILLNIPLWKAHSYFMRFPVLLFVSSYYCLFGARRNWLPPLFWISCFFSPALWTFHGALRQFVTNLVRQHSLGAIYKLQFSSRRATRNDTGYILWIILADFGLTNTFSDYLIWVRKEDYWQTVLLSWKVYWNTLAESKWMTGFRLFAETHNFSSQP